MIGRIAEVLAPRLLWRYRAQAWGLMPSEPEAKLLPRLTDRRKVSIDVGAAEGTYTAALIPLSTRVVAFEPNHDAATQLRSTFQSTALVTVEEIALSSTPGMADLRVPVDRFWRSTIESRNALRFSTNVRELQVHKRTLDSYDFHNVGFLKIDVEGHEQDVLMGADATIVRERPCMLVEIEDQHNSGAIASVFDWLGRREYSGVFFIDGGFTPIAKFDQSIHQDLRNLDPRGAKVGPYTNNFVFVPADRAARLLA